MCKSSARPANGGNGKAKPTERRRDYSPCSRLMLLERDFAALIAEWRDRTEQLSNNMQALTAEVGRMSDAMASEVRGLRAELRGKRR